MKGLDIKMVLKEYKEAYCSECDINITHIQLSETRILLICKRCEAINIMSIEDFKTIIS